jgi:pimeloyl-ACP methyl ester carboxylesterase
MLGAAGLAAATALKAVTARAAPKSLIKKGPQAMSDTPTILLVHGFWGDGAHWSKVIVQLSRLGNTRIRAVENPLTSLADDIARTRRMIAQIKGPVLLVGHSYGGMVITGAGNAPNVVGLVYIAAFAPDAGESLVDAAQAAPPPPGAASVSPDSDRYLWIDPAKFHENFCQDLSAEEALVMAVTQKAPLAGTGGDKSGAPAWRSKPSWYQISSEDRMIVPANQRRMADRIGARKVITLASGHASLASHPVEVAALIDEAARATAE